jgi:hypothetical protein
MMSIHVYAGRTDPASYRQIRLISGDLDANYGEAENGLTEWSKHKRKRRAELIPIVGWRGTTTRVSVQNAFGGGQRQKNWAFRAFSRKRHAFDSA